jgi:hypothetical protein
MTNTVKPNHLLKSVQTIFEKLKRSELNPKNKQKVFSSIRRPARHLMDEFQLSFTEAWMFSLALVNTIEGDSESNLSELAETLGSSKLEVMKLLPALISLEEKGLLLSGENGLKTHSYRQLYSPNIRFWITDPVFNMVVFGKPKEKMVFQDNIHFLEYVRHLGGQLKRFRISQSFMYSEIENTIRVNQELPAVRVMLESGVSEHERIVLWLSMLHHIQVEQFNMCELMIMTLRKVRDRVTLSTSFRNGSAKLVKEGYINLSNDEMFGETMIQLDEKGKDLLILIEPEMKDRASSNFSSDLLMMTRPEEILEVKLAFGPEVRAQFERFVGLSKQENIMAINARLANKGMKGGLTVLLSGPPGTGKTEMVKQLARINNLPLVRVEMSAIKAGFVGDSEKNVKRIFESYQELKKAEDRTPILLLNEADALISKRQGELGGSNPAVVQMLNAMQNLLLQEMEDFDGLLIATTNMESNFDPAFSRRFLYKLTVTKPDEIARFQLWQNKFPDFTKHELRQLASYDMTGAEIENIAIQSLCAEILEGNLPTLKSVLDMLHCYIDRLNTDTIGFKLSA